MTENEPKMPVGMQENRSENSVKTKGNSSEENDSMNKVDSNHHMNRMNQKQETDGTALVGGTTMQEVQTEGTLQVLEGAKSATKTEQIELPMVKEQIVQSVSEGYSEFEIQLKPEHLGTLTIRASYENNKAVVSVICSEVKSLIAVLQSSDDLAKLLQEKLGAPTQVLVELPQEDYVQQEHTQRENQSRQQEESAQQQKNEQEEAGSFLQQLRLGLIS
jgi:flagellar hook-length control protein FliK